MKLTTARLAVTALALLSLTGCPKGGDGHEGHDHDEHGHEGEHEEDGGAHGNGGHDGHDHGPPGESSETVVLTREQLDAAGVKVTTAGVGSAAATLRLTAVVGPNLDAQLHVTPKIPGVVRSIERQLGQSVSRGDVLCTLDSVELGEAVAEWIKARTLLAAQRKVLEQETALLGRQVELARTILQREESLRSREIGTVRTYYEAEQKLAEAQLERDRRVLELGATVEQLEVGVAAARARLEVFGLTSQELAELEQEGARVGADMGRVLVRAAAPGIVVDRHITLGELVETSDVLFEIHDISRVWVEARVFEKDLRLVRTGQKACVKLDALPGSCFDARVALVGAALDRESRAAVVRIEVENPRDTDVWHEPFPIRPGMFGSVELILEEREAAVVLDESAVVHEGPSTYVFVREAETEKGVTFKRREVTVRDAGAGRVEVTSGLEAGAVVATSGLFTLKSVARQGELGGGHSH
mgnify:CR=1 FL=1